MVEAVHTAVAGRTRYRVPELYRSESLKRLLELKLARIKAISRVSASSLTGTLLVCYNTGNTEESIAELIAGIVAEHHNNDHNHHNNSAGDPPGNALVPSAGSPGLLQKLFAAAEDQPQEPWHLWAAETVAVRWHTSPEQGLTDRQAAKNREAYGLNLLPESEPRSGWEIFCDQFKSLPVALLGAAAGLSVVTGGLVDAVLIMGVVVINASIGYKTESESEKIIQSLHTLVRPVALVRRQGGLQEISCGGRGPRGPGGAAPRQLRARRRAPDSRQPPVRG